VERHVEKNRVSRRSRTNGSPTNRGRFGPGFDSVVAAARTGAPWALERIYTTMSPVVLGYLRVQGAPDPEDLTNEVFLGVLRGVPSFDGTEDDFRSWVFTVAHSRLVDDRRRIGRRPQIAGDGDDAYRERVAGDAEEDAMQRLGSQRVRALCETLAADQRDVLLMRLMAGMTVESIAEALGKSEGAVKALQRRGLANLRKILEREPVPL